MISTCSTRTMFCLNDQKHQTVSTDDYNMLIKAPLSQMEFKWISLKGQAWILPAEVCGPIKVATIGFSSLVLLVQIKQSIELSRKCKIQQGRWKCVKLCRKRHKSKRERWISLFNNLNCIKVKVRLQRPMLKVTALVLLIMFEIKHIMHERTGQSISI